MKTHKFILIRIAIVVGALLIIYNGAYYTLPEYIQQDSFSFIAEIDRIFELSLIFSIVFLLFLLVEIYIFKKQQQTNLRNAAMILSLFITILVIALVYANGIF
ncbi:hypothetical protein [Flavobacterium sp. N502540]|uniref:hypothetical protein n=1 Tax=Flavobacterium sp. N502540 TaxID=2986838 RepID=UPI0022252609|nr:hypothetical protein [Flavobacterium sp. N502540]